VEVVQILRKGRIDEKDDGHVDFLMRVKALFIEAEALNFIEIDATRLRRDVACRVPYDRLVAEILCGEKYELLFAEVNNHGAL